MNKDFTESFRRVIESSTPERPEHLSAKEISLYYFDNSGDDSARIQEHLAGCKECTSLLLDLDSFTRTSTQDVSADSEVSHQWNVFTEKINSERPGVASVVDISTRRRPARSQVLAGLAIAASVILAITAGWIWFRSKPPTEGPIVKQFPALQSEPATISSPTPPSASTSPLNQQPAPTSKPGAQSTPPTALLAQNLAPIELYPDEILRGQKEIKTVSLPKSAQKVAVTLHLARTDMATTYAVKLKDEAGAIVWSGQIKSPQQAGTLRLRFSSSMFHDGVYRIAISTTGKDVAVADYSFRVNTN